MGSERLVERQSEALVDQRAPHFALSSYQGLRTLDASLGHLRHVHSLAIEGDQAIEIFQELNRRGTHEREGGGHEVWDPERIREELAEWPDDDVEERDEPYVASPSASARRFLRRLVSGEFPYLRHLELWDDYRYPTRVDRWSVEALRRELDGG